MRLIVLLTILFVASCNTNNSKPDTNIDSEDCYVVKKQTGLFYKRYSTKKLAYDCLVETRFFYLDSNCNGSIYNISQPDDNGGVKSLLPDIANHKGDYVCSFGRSMKKSQGPYYRYEDDACKKHTFKNGVFAYEYQPEQCLIE